MAADSSFDGAVFDSSKYSKLSIQEKREFIYEISKWPHSASELLQSWSRQEIIQVLCAEMGKERKYTGLTKLKIIENLLKLVSEKKSSVSEVLKETEPQSPTVGHKTTKRQRKSDNPSQISVSPIEVSAISTQNDSGFASSCKNLACRAILNQEDKFCKRCSCCICLRYDDNKDPSLWISCSSEPPFLGDSCNMSCHIECVLKDGRSGIGQSNGVDGSFYCVSCRKVNDLLGCWRKQLVHAKETRRVDILCYRVSLSQKLLHGTEKYKMIYQIVDEAVKKLEAEVGPIAGVPVKMGRGIVNRLSSGPEVQKLCASAIELLDSLLSNRTLDLLPNPKTQDSNSIPPNAVKFEDVRSTSLILFLGCEDGSSKNQVRYMLWHRKADVSDYPVEPTCILQQPKPRFIVTGLSPATDYHFKILSFEGTKELGNCEVQFSTACEVIPSCLETEGSHSHATNSSDLSNPSSVEDETTDIVPYCDRSDNEGKTHMNYSNGTEIIVSAITSDIGEGMLTDKVSLLDEENAGAVASAGLKLITNDNQSNPLVRSGMMESGPFVGCSEDGLPVTPLKLDGLGRAERSKSRFKDLDNRIRKGENGDKRAENGGSEQDFEHYVKVIRWLECEGHIEKNFRQKFLTWYSLRASQQEVKIVKVFIDTFMEDPASLAEQLVDTFSECVSSKKASVMAPGFCMKLWH